eukprot:COSAG02_NODE_778_length_17288_cov_102.024725_10_plen_149_part_00
MYEYLDYLSNHRYITLQNTEAGWCISLLLIHLKRHVNAANMTHNGFSGVTGINPKTNKKFTIPCVYSPEHRGWLVHFVIANSPEEARERGKHVEKSIRNHSRRLNDSLNDSQLMAAFAKEVLALAKWARECKQERGFALPPMEFATMA